MDIREMVAQRLLNNTTLTAITGTSIYRNRLPDTLKPPHVIITLITKERVMNHDGYSGLSAATVQISCFSASQDQAIEMDDIVTESMESWPGDGVEDSFYDGEDDIFEQATRIYHIPVDFRISYHE